MAPKVLICDKVNEKAIKMFEDAGFEVKTAWEMEKDDLPTIVGDYEAMIVRSATKVKGALMDNADKLIAIGRPGVGLDNIDLEKAKAKGIQVFNTPSATTNSVAELALTLILASTRRVDMGTIEVRKDPSSFKKIKKQLFSNEVAGKTLGVIGTGRIAQSLAQKALALGMNVIGYSQSMRKKDHIEIMPMDEVLKQADYISLHLPFTDGTKNLISKKEFEKMKNGVILVNTARGGIVNEKDAFEALKSGKMVVYATDVFENEPPSPDNPLLNHENVIITPHIGAQTLEGNTRASLEAAEKVIEVFKE